MSIKDDEIIVIDQSSMPLLLDAEIVGDKSLSALDIAVYACIIYTDCDTVSDEIIEYLCTRLKESKTAIELSIDNLDKSGLFN